MGFFKMKKLILLLAITMMAISTGLALEPTRVSVYAPQYQAGTPATSVRVDLVDYNGGATTLFTGFDYNAGQALLTADDNGVITVNVGQNATVAAAWDAIDASNMNTFWTFDVYINGALYSQGRIDQQVILQANTSIFNSSGVLVPSGNPSTIGDDNQRFDAVYVKGIEADPELEGVFIGPTGSAGSADLALQYDATLGAGGEGIISSNGVAIMNFDAAGVDLNARILDNVAEINDGNQALEISGAFTANQALNTIGDNTEGLQLTIDGLLSPQPVAAGNFELEIDGDAKMGYLEVTGFSLLGDFNMNDNTIYNVEEIIGNSTDGTLLLNSTASANPAWVNNGPITTGTGQFTINGNLDATLGVDVTNADLTVGGTNFVVDDATGNTDIAGNTTIDGNTTLGDDIANDLVEFDALVDSDILPTVTAFPTETLGNDDNRWASVYTGDIHVGQLGAEAADTELYMFYNNDVASFEVNNPTSAQFAIDATTGSEVISFDADGDGTPEASINSNNQQFLVNADDAGANELIVNAGIDQVELDPAGNGSTNYSFAEAGVTIATGGTSVVLSDGALTSSAAQEFQMVATGGNLDVLIDGKIDVEAAASTMGDGADATQLTVEGLVAGANDALVVQGSTDIDARLNVDGNTTLNEDVTLGDDLATDLTVFNSKVNSSIQPNGAATAFTLGTDAERWADLYVLGSSVHVGDADGVANFDELALSYAANQARFSVGDGTSNTNPQMVINSTGNDITLDPNADADQNFVFENTGLTIDSDEGAGIDMNITETGIRRLSAANQTFTFENTLAGNLNVIVDGNIDVQSAASTIGDGADATQLTIEGLVAGANDALVVQGSTDIDARLNVDGNTTLNGDVDLGDGVTDLITPVGRFDDTMEPNVTNTYDLGLNTLRWRNIWLGNNANVGNNLDVDNDANIDGDLVVDLTSTLTGVVDAQAAANTIGDGTDGTQLTIEGSTANVGPSELIVEGEVDIDGDLVVDQTATIVGIFDAQDLGNSIGDDTDALQLTVDGQVGSNNVLVVEGNTDIDGALNADGATTLNGTVALGDAAADEITVNGEFVSSLIPTAASTTVDLGTSTQTWRDLHLSNNAEIANDANIGNNAVVENEIRLIETADATDYVGFVAPGDVTASQIWTLPVADGTADQQLITDGSGNLSWGSTSLQVAYEGGNEIITDAGDGDVIIRGTEELDIRVNIANDVAGNGAGITVDDDFTVVNGDIDFGSNNFTIIGSNGNTTTQGTLTTQGLVTANAGMNVFNANLTVGGSNFVVTPGGATTVEGILTANNGLTVNDANFVVGATNLFQVNELNGNTTVGGILDQSTGTAMGDLANVISITGTGATYNTASLSGTHPAGSVVHISFPNGLNNVQDTRGLKSNIFGCTVVKDGNGNWYIVSVYE